MDANYPDAREEKCTKGEKETFLSNHMSERVRLGGGLRFPNLIYTKFVASVKVGRETLLTTKESRLRAA